MHTYFLNFALKCWPTFWSHEASNLDNSVIMPLRTSCWFKLACPLTPLIYVRHYHVVVYSVCSRTSRCTKISKKKKRQVIIQLREPLAPLIHFNTIPWGSTFISPPYLPLFQTSSPYSTKLPLARVSLTLSLFPSLSNIFSLSLRDSHLLRNCYKIISSPHQVKRQILISTTFILSKIFIPYSQCYLQHFGL